MRRRTNVRRFVLLNVAYVLALGIYGLALDEPYWRAVGHGPNSYDVLVWLGLLVNGPSGFLAEGLAASIVPRAWLDTAFVLSHLLWSLLLAAQWCLYIRLARWTTTSATRKLAINIVVLALAVLGAVAAREAWLFAHQPTECGCEVHGYYWFSRVLGLASSAVMIVFGRWLVRRTGSRRPPQTPNAATHAPPCSRVSP